MGKNGHVKEIQSGALDDSFLFLRQQRIKSSTGDLDLVLPGEIVRCDGASAFACTGAGVIVLGDATPSRAALVTAGVGDTAALVEALVLLGKSVDKDSAKGFAVRLHAGKDVGDLVAGEVKGGGCGCAGGAARCQGSLAAGLLPAKGDKFVWSDPVAAEIAASDFPMSSVNRGKKECSTISVGPNATACYGSWRMTWNGWLPETWTLCVGRCSSGECCIRRTAGGTCVATDSGWKSCSCI